MVRKLVRACAFAVAALAVGCGENAGQGGRCSGGIGEAAWSHGSVFRSSNDHDVALPGEGYFVLASEDGPRYTRAGHLMLDEQGRIVSTGALPVLGFAAEDPLGRPRELRVPAHAGADGGGPGDPTGFEVTEWDGVAARYSNGARLVLGRLAVATFEDPTALERVDLHLLAATPGCVGAIRIGPAGDDPFAPVLLRSLEDLTRAP